MSDLRIVKGNDFATLYAIRAMYSDGTVVEDFDLQSCTDVQVIVHRSYSRGVTSSLAANEYGSFSIEPENILRINWDGLLVKLGTYTVDFRAKFRGADIRSYSIKDLIFDIVETNEEANIPAGAFVDNGAYVFSGDFVLMFESQVQADWDESDISSPAYIKNKPTIPSSLAELSEDAEHRTVTDAEIAEWNAKQDAIADIDEIRSGAAAGATAYQLPATGIPKAELSEQVQTSLEKADTAYQLPSGGVPYDELSQSVQDSLNEADTAYQKPTNGIPSTDMTSAVQSSLAKADTAYQKPSTGIPASDIASGVIPDVSQFITRSVDDLVNYYLKSETYTKTEVQGLIAAINQFHYEIYPSASAVTNPQGNVLYLIGPTGTGNDKYEEYVYANNTWVKIGDTSIDLSGYITTQALNAALASYSTTSQMNNAIAAALANYTTTANLNTLLAGKQDVLTFDNVPTEGSNNPVKSGGVYSSLEQLDAQIEAEQGSIKEEIVDIAKPVTFSSIPMLCGQPMILFGNGTPQEAIVPDNWIQFLDGGYNWTGLPSALGQVYINTAVISGGRYTAAWNGNVLKWVNS